MVCYTEKQVSEMIGISQIKLKTDRMKLQGIPFVKIGRCVRYRKEDVSAYLEANRQATEEAV